MEEHTNYLAHHGVKGQRWGIRRYQNPDGSLTSAGRKKLLKYQKKVSKYTERHAKFEKKAYKAVKRNNADKLLKYKKKSIKALKKQAKFENKAYKLQKHMNKYLKKVDKKTKDIGKNRVNEVLKEVS